MPLSIQYDVKKFENYWMFAVSTAVPYHASNQIKMQTRKTKLTIAIHLLLLQKKIISKTCKTYFLKLY